MPVRDLDIAGRVRRAWRPTGYARSCTSKNLRTRTAENRLLVCDDRSWRAAAAAHVEAESLAADEGVPRGGGDRDHGHGVHSQYHRMRPPQSQPSSPSLGDACNPP